MDFVLAPAFYDGWIDADICALMFFEKKKKKISLNSSIIWEN